MVFVKYFIPEDGDDQLHPNVFKVNGCENVAGLTLGHIKKSFPVAGKYHFRFLQELGGTVKVWMDCINETEIVPHSVDNEVFAKVSRIGVHHYNIAHPPSSSSAGRSPTESESTTRRESFGNPNTGDRTSISSQNSGGGNSRRNSERLISFEGDSPSKSPFHADNNNGTGVSSSGGDEGLLDFGGDDGDFTADFSEMGSTSNSSTSDLFSLDAANISQVPLGVSPAPSPMQHNPIGGGFAANNPMGGGSMNRGQMNGT